MQWITARVFDNAMEAHLLRTQFESEGIPCVLFDEHLVNLNPLYSVAVGGIKLKIRESDRERALELLNTLDKTAGLDEHKEALTCPECASTDLYSNFKSMKGTKGFLAAVVSFLLAVFPIYYKTVYKCKQCGAEFRNN